MEAVKKKRPANKITNNVKRKQYKGQKGLLSLQAQILISFLGRDWCVQKDSTERSGKFR